MTDAKPEHRTMPPERPLDDPQISDTQAEELPAAARRALAEAAARRAAAAEQPMPTELGGRKGPEPVRYGDWERKGIAVDF